MLTVMPANGFKNVSKSATLMLEKYSKNACKKTCKNARKNFKMPKNVHKMPHKMPEKAPWLHWRVNK